MPDRSEVAGVVGDAYSTKLVFKIPSEYDDWIKCIRWHCTIKDSNGDTIVNPVYPLDDDDSFTIPPELIPPYDLVVGYNLSLYKTTDSSTIVENSITSTIYISGSQTPFAAGTSEDVIQRLLDALLAAIASIEYAEDPEAATTTQTARPKLISTMTQGGTEETILNVPYLNSDGYIDDRFYAPARMPSRIFIIEAVSDLLDLPARQEDMAYVISGDSAGNLYLLVADDPTSMDNWKLIRSLDPVFTTLTTTGDATIGGDLTAQGYVSVSGDAGITGDLDVDSDASVGGDMSVTGDLTVSSDTTLEGNVTLSSITEALLVTDSNGEYQWVYRLGL